MATATESAGRGCGSCLPARRRWQRAAWTASSPRQLSLAASLSSRPACLDLKLCPTASNRSRCDSCLQCFTESLSAWCRVPASARRWVQLMMRTGCKGIESASVSLQDGDMECAAAAAAVVSSDLLPRWAQPKPHGGMSLGSAQVTAETRATGRSWRPKDVSPQRLQMATACSSLHPS